MARVSDKGREVCCVVLSVPVRDCSAVCEHPGAPVACIGSRTQCWCPAYDRIPRPWHTLLRRMIRHQVLAPFSCAHPHAHLGPHVPVAFLQLSLFLQENRPSFAPLPTSRIPVFYLENFRAAKGKVAPAPPCQACLPHKKGCSRAAL